MTETRAHKVCRLGLSILMACMLGLIANAFAPQGARMADNISFADDGASAPIVQTVEANGN